MQDIAGLDWLTGVTPETEKVNGAPEVEASLRRRARADSQSDTERSTKRAKLASDSDGLY